MSTGVIRRSDRWWLVGWLAAAWTGLALADANSDVSNERPPMTAAQLEAHWGLDCNQLAETLTSGMPDVATDARSRLADNARRCAMIYNRPDSPWHRPCPDFGAMAGSLESGQPALNDNKDVCP